MTLVHLCARLFGALSVTLGSPLCIGSLRLELSLNSLRSTCGSLSLYALLIPLSTLCLVLRTSKLWLMLSARGMLNRKISELVSESSLTWKPFLAP